jgi:hypothetical protein
VPQAPGPQAPGLSDVDAALAAEVDALLEGEFESVSEVLQSVFEETAAVVETGAADATVWPGQRTAASTPPSSSVAPPQAAPVKDRTPGAAPGSRPAAQDTHAARAPVPAPMPAPAPESAPAPLPVPAPVTPTSPAQVPATTAATAPFPLRIWRRVEPGVIAVLRILNLPQRRLPARVRPLLDWLALTLVFWVPVVWLIAVLLVG